MASFFPGQQHHGAPAFGVGGDSAQALQAARGAGSGEGTAGRGEEEDEEGDVNAVLAAMWGMEPGRGNSPTGERQDLHQAYAEPGMGLAAGEGDGELGGCGMHWWAGEQGGDFDPGHGHAMNEWVAGEGGGFGYGEGVGFDPGHGNAMMGWATGGGEDPDGWQTYGGQEEPAMMGWATGDVEDPDGWQTYGGQEEPAMMGWATGDVEDPDGWQTYGGQEEPEEVMRECWVLWVGSLPPRCTEEELLEAFRVYGPIGSVTIKSQQQSGLVSSLGFVNFMDEHGAFTAYDHMYDGEVGGYEIKLREPQAKSLLCPAWPINIDVADPEEPGWASWCEQVGWNTGEHPDDGEEGWGAGGVRDETLVGFGQLSLGDGEGGGVGEANLNNAQQSQEVPCGGVETFPSLSGAGVDVSPDSFDPDRAAFVGPSFAAAAASELKAGAGGGGGGGAGRQGDGDKEGMAMRKELIASEASGRVQLFGVRRVKRGEEEEKKEEARDPRGRGAKVKIGKDMLIGDFFAQDLSHPKMAFERCQQLAIEMAGDRGGKNPYYTSNPYHFKAKLCRIWMETGSCDYESMTGRKCDFAHGRDELRAVVGGGGEVASKLDQALFQYINTQCVGRTVNGTPFVSLRGCPQWAVTRLVQPLLQRRQRKGEAVDVVVIAGVGGQDTRTGRHKHTSHTKGRTLESLTRELLIECPEVDRIWPMFTKDLVHPDNKIFGSFLVRLAPLV